jgi:hypothetical protein
MKLEKQQSIQMKQSLERKISELEANLAQHHEES